MHCLVLDGMWVAHMCLVTLMRAVYGSQNVRGSLTAQELNVIHINTDLSLSTCCRKRGSGRSSTEGQALQALDTLGKGMLKVKAELVFGDASGARQHNMANQNRVPNRPRSNVSLASRSSSTGRAWCR